MAAQQEDLWRQQARAQAASLRMQALDPIRFFDEMRSWAFQYLAALAPVMSAPEVVSLIAALDAEVKELDDAHAAQWLARREIEAR